MSLIGGFIVNKRVIEGLGKGNPWKSIFPFFAGLWSSQIRQRPPIAPRQVLSGFISASLATAAGHLRMLAALCVAWPQALKGIIRAEARQRCKTREEKCLTFCPVVFPRLLLPMLKYCPARLHWKLPWPIWKRQVARTVQQEVSDGKGFRDLASTDVDLQCQTWTYLG